MTSLDEIKYYIPPVLYDYLKTLESGEIAEGVDIAALKDTVGNSTKGLVKAVNDLTSTVGDSESGLVEDVTALETAVGDNSSGLVKGVADINATIGDEETADTILYRIKALEDAANTE